MISLRKARAGLVPARVFSILLACSSVAFAAPAAASTASAAAAVAAPADTSRASVEHFYRERLGRPLFLAEDGGKAAGKLLDLLHTADADGLNPAHYEPAKIAIAIAAAANGEKALVHKAELMLARAFVAYARDLKRVPDVGIHYVDRELIPVPRSAEALLTEAAQAPSLEAYVDKMGWMNPAYAPLRRALLAGGDEAQARLIALNLERARSLPGGRGRYVLVNTAAQRLYMYEGDKLVDTMRVVVGKPKYPTPMLAAFIRFASLNPYWYVPPDLAAERIAPNVVKLGLKYLNSKGYDVLTDFSVNGRMIDPATIDWQAVADGKVEVMIRQRPGPENAMGRMKFMFPNREGVYLHDTPDKELLSEASRLFSGGCVRLEDAPRLGRWLFGMSLEPQGAAPEQQVHLETPVPVYLTYMTAEPSGSTIAFFDDIYGRDAARTAQLGGSLPQVKARR